jgi:hypothetical protein
MGFLKEFNDLHVTVKSLAISIGALMPFVYLSIVLFAQGYIMNYQFQVPVVISFCVATIWYLIHAFSLSLFDESSNNNLIKDKSTRHIMTPLLSTLSSIFWISFLMLVAYLNKWGFFKMLTIGASIALIRILFYRFIIWISPKARVENNEVKK